MDSAVPDQKIARLHWLGPVPDYSRHRKFFHFGTGLIRCRRVRHSSIYTHEHALAHAHRPMMNRGDHEQEHGRAAWTWSMDMEMDKHHGCQNADKKFSLPSLVFR